ncbi:hypothetical protein NPIL_104621 [Nephila pilipes]|uniref:Uncharacterized protein n=1 Tax=Nephila pilipes TaxID=299642 RepID=A0A8X6TXL8_NEPPI|nr:hypothetical protein NPIL_104621 [Nephila pilipes]
MILDLPQLHQFPFLNHSDRSVDDPKRINEILSPGNVAKFFKITGNFFPFWDYSLYLWGPLASYKKKNSTCLAYITYTDAHTQQNSDKYSQGKPTSTILPSSGAWTIFKCPSLRNQLINLILSYV